MPMNSDEVMHRHHVSSPGSPEELGLSSGIGHHSSDVRNLPSPATATPTAADLKKLRRNERDRKRSFLKREAIKDMKKVLEQLEMKKHSLINQQQRTNAMMSNTQSDQTQHINSTDSPVKRADFVAIAERIEALRRENATMTKELQSRDLFNSAMQHLLLDITKDQERLESNPDFIGFPLLTEDEGASMALETIQQVAKTRHKFATTDQELAKNAKVFGWSDFRRQRDSTINFVAKKKLYSTSPAEIMAKTWHLMTDFTQMRRLLPGHVSCELRVVQKLSDDLLVIDRRTEDRARSLPGRNSNMMVLRTFYLLSRCQDSDGSYLLTMKTIDSPVLKQLVRDDELWCDIFYWIRIGTVQKIPDNHRDVRIKNTIAEFGGILTYIREEIAAAWLAELVFLAIRWESITVSPFLLTT